ncbi:hypothetical protein NMG60_11035875 [Bertholletia excelsa]
MLVGSEVEEDHLYDYDDEESYIEIALEPELSLPQLSFHEEEKVEHEDKKTMTGDEEIELRISLSSSNFSFPVFSSSSHTLRSSTTNSTPFCSSKCSTDSGDSPTPNSPAGAGGSKSSVLFRNQSSNRRRVQIPGLHRFFNLLLSAVNPQPSSRFRNDDQNRQVTIGSGSRELVRSRKTTKAVSRMNNGATKFFIKFQSFNIRSTLCSLLKPQKTISSCEGSRESSKAIGLKSYRRLMIKPFESTDRNRDRLRSSSSCRRGERKRATEINNSFDGILKGVLDSLSANRRSGRSRDKQMKSCPSSLKSSPIHESDSSRRNRIYEREDSVQAAIAHCKKSLGQTP